MKQKRRKLQMVAVLVAALTMSAIAEIAIAESGKVKSITLATTPTRIPAVRPDGRIDTPERPGFRVEILRSAGRQCGVDVNFAPVPWARALELVKNGDVQGVFNSSYSEERTAYGAYPMKNGVPDSRKAMTAYTYGLYVHPDSQLGWDGKTVTALGSDKKILVEEGSVAVKMIGQAGLQPLETARYPNMVRMLAEKRAQGMVAIDTNVDDVLAKEPQLAAHIKRLAPPFATVYGYVMFARPFYTANSELVECFWTALGEIRAKPEYEALVRSYNNGQFIE